MDFKLFIQFFTCLAAKYLLRNFFFKLQITVFWEIILELYIHLFSNSKKTPILSTYR